VRIGHEAQRRARNIQISPRENQTKDTGSFTHLHQAGIEMHTSWSAKLEAEVERLVMNLAGIPGNAARKLVMAMVFCVSERGHFLVAYMNTFRHHFSDLMDNFSREVSFHVAKDMRTPTLVNYVFLSRRMPLAL
jgi:hypothetical protein